ncbi:vWA domain-containing protein [Acinetobacter wuhouensis]|uniref:vWA domain-containing protein n=1 Tax=Acinetobacter wuhouensis TaxID=1879050 RepID=UPI002077558F|nr:VWA domain-containing protein [Acinetobacter wuhouensis]
MNFHLKTQFTILSLAIVSLAGCTQMQHNQSATVVEVAPIAPMPVSAAPMSDAKTLARQAAYAAHNRKLVQSSATSGSRVSIRQPEMIVREKPQPVQNTEKYQENEINPVKSVAQEAVSTFSIDVDTGSYSNVRRFLNSNGQLPPVDAVRIEELINYFNYDYPLPTGQHPFSVTTETVDSPWKNNAKVIKIGIKAKDIDAKNLPPANLVFLVDVSGSMNDSNKLPLVKTTLRTLTEQLRPQDKVTIITYASGEKLVLEPTSGKEKDKILSVINKLQAQGSTSGERAIRMAYEEAEKSMIKSGINRILIATDGDFNVGITDFNTLKGMVAEKRKTGISFTTLGFGTDNYNEQLMEQLADAGDGNYSYIDNEKEAKKVLQRQLSSTLATVAQDVKIQVEFNPHTVKEYRLIGYENRLLNQEDFNNDQVDAGDIGAGHTVTALYEIIPTGQAGWLNESRYQTAAKSTDANKNAEYAFLNLRYKQPNEKTSILLNQPIKVQSKALSQASTDTQFAIAVASYGQKLQGGKYSANQTWNDIQKLAKQSDQPDPFQIRSEFIDLIGIAKSLSANAKE